LQLALRKSLADGDAIAEYDIDPGNKNLNSFMYKYSHDHQLWTESNTTQLSFTSSIYSQFTLTIS
jgi:hypothetical protein